MKTFQEYALVDGWHDGDTFYGIIDQGYGVYRARRVLRAAGGWQLIPLRVRCPLIDAPELRVDRRDNPAGIAALGGAESLAPPGAYPCITYRPTDLSDDSDSFGRPLADLVLPDGRLFSDAMLTAGFAVPYHG